MVLFHSFIYLFLYQSNLSTSHGFAGAAASSSRVQATPFAPIASNGPFVGTSGTDFVLSGQVIYPSGTNWCGSRLAIGRFCESVRLQP